MFEFFRYPKNVPWYQRPVYWDRNEEPQFLGDALFTGIVYLFPLLVATVFTSIFAGLNHLLSYDGAKGALVWGAALTLGWWIFLWRSTKTR